MGHPDHGFAVPRLPALLRDYTDWQIERFGVSPAWVAVTRRGTFLHIIAAHDLDELRAKLEKATGEGQKAERSGR
jgi:hypothetical protein